MQCCNKHVIIYSGARVSEFIRAIRSFISIDYNKTLTTETVVCYIGTMFMQVEQGTKHPEAGP